MKFFMLFLMLASVNLFAKDCNYKPLPDDEPNYAHVGTAIQINDEYKFEKCTKENFKTCSTLYFQDGHQVTADQLDKSKPRCGIVSQGATYDLTIKAGAVIKHTAENPGVQPYVWCLGKDGNGIPLTAVDAKKIGGLNIKLYKDTNPKSYGESDSKCFVRGKSDNVSVKDFVKNKIIITK